MYAMWMNDPWSFNPNGTWLNGGYTAGPDDVTPVYTFLAFLLWCTFILATFGNTTVLTALAKDDSTRDQCTMPFVGALSMTALLPTFVSTWALAVTMVTPAWRFGIMGCKVIAFVRNIYVYLCFLAAVSVDRYVVMKRPYQPVISVRATWAMVIAIFLVNVVLIIPRVAWAYTEMYGADHIVVCVDVGVDLVEPFVAAVHGLVCRLICCFLPLAIAWASYAGIGFALLASRDTVRW